MERITLGWLTFNAAEDPDLRLWVTKFTGLGTAPAVSSPTSRVGADGSWSPTVFFGGRTYLLEGMGVAASVADRVWGQRALTRLGAELRNDLRLTWLENGGECWAPVHLAGELKLDEVNPVTFAFSIPLWSDASAYFLTQPAGAGQATTLLPNNNGGLVRPATRPATRETGSVDGQVTLSNYGTGGMLSLTISGPLTGPSVQWWTNNRSGVLSWPSLTLASNEYLVVSNEADYGATWSALLQGQSPRWPTAAEWPPTDDGDVTFLFGAVTGSTTASLTVRLTPGLGG